MVYWFETEMGIPEAYLGPCQLTMYYGALLQKSLTA